MCSRSAAIDLVALNPAILDYRFPSPYPPLLVTPTNALTPRASLSSTGLQRLGFLRKLWGGTGREDDGGEVGERVAGAERRSRFRSAVRADGLLRSGGGRARSRREEMQGPERLAKGGAPSASSLLSSLLDPLFFLLPYLGDLLDLTNILRWHLPAAEDMGYVAGHSHLGKSEMVSADLGDVEWKQNTRRGKVGLTTARPNGIGESSDSEIMGRVVGELDEDDADSGGRCKGELTATWTIPARTLHQDSMLANDDLDLRAGPQTSDIPGVSTSPLEAPNLRSLYPEDCTRCS
ncbi:hypothetical protein FA13DRAFT_1710875 [Coprinellus micaceus]|uniref:Uncharacterized protein n=1 Tax=Coprinellus micaceus TaxID=71717 RepID=A0A4Y7T664_COPMI|nr:hypothetical protein FA13DRAFT_1710875 [Coprinellus micaceus]